MKRKFFRKLMPIVLSTAILLGNGPNKIQWEPWSKEAFDRAKRENKLVLLDLEAIWCHWCHVMDEETYQDAEVIELINAHYITVRVDQDSRPDLSNKYEDYGWPATIIFNQKKQDIVKRSGFIEPADMRELLKETWKHPVFEESSSRDIAAHNSAKYGGKGLLGRDQRAKLEALVQTHYDFKEGGWDLSHKFLDAYLVDYLLKKSKNGDAPSAKMLKQFLTADSQLIDPVWGGAYQYSTGNVWNKPHFEKIMSVQADTIGAFSHAYAQTLEAGYLAPVEMMIRYVDDFLTSPEGAFYTSQDADLVKGQHSGDYFKLNNADRRKQGIPWVDKHIYARENGWLIDALVSAYTAAPGQPSEKGKKYLAKALQAAEWIDKNRNAAAGSFRHGEPTTDFYLGDQVSMARAFLSLYSVTGDRAWLKRAEDSAHFIDRTFRSKKKGSETAGYLTTAETSDDFLSPEAQGDENIVMARFANLLSHYTGKSEYRKMGEHAMKYLVGLDYADRIHMVTALLLADEEFKNPPVHLTIVGKKKDPKAWALFNTAIKYPDPYKRVEWLDSDEGPLPNPDVKYPTMKEAAAFACADHRCSLPAFKPEQIFDRIKKITK
jgi:uncharacterized protein YyaL (SSP411 family)